MTSACPGVMPWTCGGVSPFCQAPTSPRNRRPRFVNAKTKFVIPEQSSPRESPGAVQERFKIRTWNAPRKIEEAFQQCREPPMGAFSNASDFRWDLSGSFC